MSPPPTAATAAPTTEVAPNKASKLKKGALDINLINKAKIEESKKTEYEFDDLTPAFPDIKYPPLEKFEYKDKALDADPNYPNLFAAASKVVHLTQLIGTELHGINLAELTDAQKDELALLTAHRGVVFFRDQKDLDIDKQLDLGRYWGKLHVHATTAVPKAWKEKNLEEVHVVYADDKRPPSQAYTQTQLWHSDVTYELQPAAYTTLKLLDGPDEGGHTVWGSGYALYDSLSPQLRQYLEGLTALHSAHEQANDSLKFGNPVRRDPILTEHPLVRTHPVTGYKSVFVNPGFTRVIKGIPKGESDLILNYLFTLIATSQEHTVRLNWKKNDVALWDNRVTFHSATYGFYPHRRHAVRVTVTGEAPYYDPNGKSQQEALDEAIGLKRTYDGSVGFTYND
ncbi:alpha-ketoglutarate-dependent sulfonate dioxygenase [Trichomonascus vanleenenianus]|uniref:TauD/TfdA dioxygenase family protein n=1 Tax=Trichomonascus vanleenenianus TaxID=2268995 RepID=UPI003ECB9231